MPPQDLRPMPEQPAPRPLELGTSLPGALDHAWVRDRARVGSYRPGSLPPQVRRALDLLCAGCTYTEIARAMGVSAWTVKTMLRQAYRSLGVRHKGEAVAVWLQSATIHG